MKISDKCLQQLIHHEGMRFRPYLCPAHVWTCGVGSVLYPEQIRLPISRVKDPSIPLIRKEFKLKKEHDRLWTKEEVLELLKSDLRRFERGVLRLFPGHLTQGQFDALVSFSFNVGLGTLQRSTLRQKFNRGDIEGTAAEFLRFTKAGGKVLRGLVNRRNDEVALFRS